MMVFGSGSVDFFVAVFLALIKILISTYNLIVKLGITINFFSSLIRLTCKLKADFFIPAISGSVFPCFFPEKHFKG